MFKTCVFAITAIGLSATTAFACIVSAEMDFRDILLADAVVVGDIVSYEIVDPDPDPDLNRGSLLNYARFEVYVREVILPKGAGRVVPPARSDPEDGKWVQGRLITVTWDNSTFGEPEDLEDVGYPGYLIALRDPTSDLPPLRSGSAFIAATPEPEHYTVLQAPCSGAFIFERDSMIAIALRQLLTTDRDKDAEWEVLSEFLFDNGAMWIDDRKLKSEPVEVP
jgi:hypothetical protein